MSWYFYHPETREFLREASRNPRKLPNATKVAPPPRYSRHYFGYRGDTVAIFDPETEKWIETPDCRREWEDEKGKRYPTGFSGYYLPLEGDEPGSAPRFNEKPGPMPEGACLSFPGMDRMKDELLSDIQKAYVLGVCELLETDDPLWQHGVFIPGLDMTMKLDYIGRAARGDEGARKLFDAEFGDRIKLACMHEKLDALRLEMAAGKRRIREILAMENGAYGEMYRLYSTRKRDDRSTTPA